MMIVPSNRFKQDLELAIKRGLKIELLVNVVNALAKGIELDIKDKNHSLIGDYKDFEECHIQSDWLLIYRIDKENQELYLFRTGTHNDLF